MCNSGEVEPVQCLEDMASPRMSCCGKDTYRTVVVNRVSAMYPLPQTVKSWQVFGRWQCCVAKEHTGRWGYYTDELSAQVLSIAGGNEGVDGIG